MIQTIAMALSLIVVQIHPVREAETLRLLKINWNVGSLLLRMSMRIRTMMIIVRLGEAICF